MTARTAGNVPVIRRLLRRALVATGVVAFGLAISIAMVPDAARLFPAERAVSAVGSDYVVVAAIGLVAVGLSALVVVGRHLWGVDEATPPAVEDVQSATRPGTAFDRQTGAGRDSDRRDRLRKAAARATMRAEGCSLDAAESRVADGSWTDDDVAGRHLRGPSQADRRVAVEEGWSTHRTVAAIERLTAAGSSPPADGSDPSGDGKDPAGDGRDPSGYGSDPPGNGKEREPTEAVR